MKSNETRKHFVTSYLVKCDKSYVCDKYYIANCKTDNVYINFIYNFILYA